MCDITQISKMLWVESSSTTSLNRDILTRSRAKASKLLGFRGVPGGGYFSGLQEAGYRLGKNDDVSATFSRTAIEANTSSLPKLCVSKAHLRLVSSLLRFL